MPFKSKAQRRFMYAAEARGDVPGGTAARWEAHTKDKNLPERVKKAGEQSMRSESFLQGFVDGLNKLAGIGDPPGKVTQPGAVENPLLKQMRLQKQLKVQKAQQPEPSKEDFGPPAGTDNPFMPRPRR